MIHTSPKLRVNSFNRQFTTSKLGKHSLSRRTRQVSKDVKRMSLEEAESFTSDQVTSTIKSCRTSRAYGPDSLSIFHLKNLGPLATEHLTAIYNDPLKTCRLPSIWKTSLVIPIPKPGQDSSALLQLTTDIETGFNQRKPPYSVCGHRLDSCL